jgi:methionine sulfoxide reductase heme-binding subunit
MKKIILLLTSWNIVRGVLFATVASGALFFKVFGFNATTLFIAVRLTARMSGLLFSMAFTASSFHLLAHNSFSKWMLKNRRYIGVSFASVHLIHLGLIVSLQLIFKAVIPSIQLFNTVIGIVAYVFVIAMLFTSFPRFSGKLSKKQWKLLHTVGGYWIWMVFMYTYMQRAKNDYLYLALTLFFAAVFLIRLYKKKPGQGNLAAG